MTSLSENKGACEEQSKSLWSFAVFLEEANTKEPKQNDRPGAPSTWRRGMATTQGVLPSNNWRHPLSEEGKADIAYPTHSWTPIPTNHHML